MFQQGTQGLAFSYTGETGQGRVMRVEGVKIKEVFQNLMDLAIAGANAVMADHVADAKRRCPVRKNLTEGTRYREEGNVLRDVIFTPKTGKGRGKYVNFIADTPLGRVAGSLKASIRKVEKTSRPGNIRVYAGAKKTFYARFVEYGTSHSPKQPFMRPSFQAIKGTAQARIEEEMRKCSEVR